MAATRFCSQNASPEGGSSFPSEVFMDMYIYMYLSAQSSEHIEAFPSNSRSVADSLPELLLSLFFTENQFQEGLAQNLPKLLSYYFKWPTGDN